MKFTLPATVVSVTAQSYGSAMVLRGDQGDIGMAGDVTFNITEDVRVKEGDQITITFETPE